MLRRRLGITFCALAIVILLGANLLQDTKASAAIPPPPSPSAADVTVVMLDAAHMSLTASGTYNGADLSGATGVYYADDINHGNSNGGGILYNAGGSKHAGFTQQCLKKSGIVVDDFSNNWKNGTGTDPIEVDLYLPPGGTTSNSCVHYYLKTTVLDGDRIGGTYKDATYGTIHGVSSRITEFLGTPDTIFQADDDPTYDSGYSDQYSYQQSTNKTTGIGATYNNNPFFSQRNGAGCPNGIEYYDNTSDPGHGHLLSQGGSGGNCTPNAGSAKEVLILGERPDTGIPGAPGTNSSSGTDDLCPISTWGLRWVACPLVDAAQTGVQTMDKVLQSLLIIDANDTFGTGATGQAYYSGFRSFQGIALSILVIVALIMVVGQAMGFELLDAYTIRKVLPRMVAMVILLAILWPVLKFVVIFFDNMTNWTGDIIAAPFRGLGPETKTSIVAIAGQYLVGGASIVAFGILGILSLAATLFLSILTLIVILLGRKLIILVCIITSPVAVVCSILPNTRKVSKVWIDAYLPAELAGVAIAATEGAGVAMAHVATAANIGGVGGTVSVIIVVITQFILVIVVQRVGGTISTITGVANDRRRGLNDRLKNYRGNKLKQRGAAMARGDLYSNNRAGRLFNAATRNTTTAAKSFAASPSISPRSARGKYTQARDQQTAVAASAIAQSEGFKNNANNDDFLMTADYANANAAVRGLTQRFGGDAAAQTRAQNAVAAAQAAGMQIGSQGFQVAAGMGRNSTGTGYTTHTDADGNVVEAMEDQASTLARAARGNTALATRLAGFANAENKKVGRHDLAPGFGTTNSLVQAQVANGGARADRQAITAAIVEAARGTDNATLVRDKPESVANITRALDSTLSNAQLRMQVAQRNNDQAGIQEAATTIAQVDVKLQNMQQSGLYAPEVNLQPLALNTVPVTTGPQGQRTAVGQQVQQVTANARQATAASDAFDRNPGIPLQAPPLPTPAQRTMAEVAQRDTPVNRGFGGPDDPRFPGAP